jgi:hypothetical protein
MPFQRENQTKAKKKNNKLVMSQSQLVGFDEFSGSMVSFSWLAVPARGYQDGAYCLD